MIDKPKTAPLCPVEIVEGMELIVLSGFPCRRWLTPFRGPNKVFTPVEFHAGGGLPLTWGYLLLTVVWCQPPYVVAEHRSDEPIGATRMWFDARDAALWLHKKDRQPGHRRQL